MFQRSERALEQGQWYPVWAAIAAAAETLRQKRAREAEQQAIGGE